MSLLQLHPTQGKLLSNPPTFPLHSSKQKWHIPNFENLRLTGMSTKCSITYPIPILQHNSTTSVIMHNIVDTVAIFFTLKETDILQISESLVTKHSNPAAHCLTFSNTYQNQHEFIKDYLVHLQTSAMDCEFACPNCRHDLLTTHI